MRGAQAANVDPQRVVATRWLPAELLLALGVTPYGVADIPNYRLWVNEPALPDSVIDVGLRTEPNLELLTQMKPSFIVWSAGYGPSPEKLARIAPAADSPLATANARWRWLSARCWRWLTCWANRSRLSATGGV